MDIDALLNNSIYSLIMQLKFQASDIANSIGINIEGGALNLANLSVNARASINEYFHIH